MDGDDDYSEDDNFEQPSPEKKASERQGKIESQYSEEEFDEEVMDGVDVVDKNHGAATPVQVAGNQVEGEAIADVAVFSSIPMSTPIKQEEDSNNRTPTVYSEQPTEGTAMGARNEPHVRPETQDTMNKVLEYSPQAKRGSHESQQTHQ